MRQLNVIAVALWSCLLSACHSLRETAPDMPPVEIRALAPGVWQHTSYSILSGGRVPSNGLIVQQGDHLLLVDTAWGEPQTASLLGRIQSEIGLPVRTALITHAHADRVSGTDVLTRAGVSVLASSLTRTLAKQSDLPVPEGSIEALAAPRSSVMVGNVEVIFPGAGHAPDNLVVWVPEQKVLFGGCTVRALAWSLGPLDDADPESWRRSNDFLRHRFGMAEVVVPGHGDAGSIALLQHTDKLLGDRAGAN